MHTIFFYDKENNILLKSYLKVGMFYELQQEVSAKLRHVSWHGFNGD